MKTTKNLFLLIAFFTVSIIAQAQILTPVKWTKSVKMTDDRNGVITFTATIDNGWHMYSNDSPADGPTPLSVNWKNTKGVKLVGRLTPSKAPTTIDDEAFILQEKRALHPRRTPKKRQKAMIKPKILPKKKKQRMLL